MSSLRRDLFERRLWPLVAVLLAAVVAVPLLLLKHAPASNARVLAPPNVVVPGLPAASRAAVKAAPTLPGAVPRNPFASGMPKLTAKPAAALASTSSPAGTQATLVTPSPAASSTQSPATTSTPTTGSGSPQGTSSATTPTTPTTTSGAATTTTHVASQASTQTWTIYAADLRYGKNTKATVLSDLARLTLLPSPKQPELMFMGVVAGGKQAVFALAAGVQHKGPGLCRPRRQQCSAILLRAGQTEQITVATPIGGQRRTILRLVRVRSRVTRSRSVALAAYKRQSAAGRCDLYLAEPMSYSQSEGTLSAVTGGSCRHQPAAVPFPSAVTIH
jgi:hypothetical protein